MAWLDEMSEAVFGHVETEEEKMRKIKDDIDAILKECERSRIRNHIDMDQSKKQQTLLSKKGDYEGLKREARVYVMKEKEALKLERNKNRIVSFKSQLDATRIDSVLSKSKLTLMDIKADQTQHLLDQKQVMNILNRYKYQRDSQRNIMDLIDDEMEEEEEEEEEEELNSVEEEKIDELIKFNVELANHAEFDKLPKPVGTLLSHNVLHAPEKEMKRMNQEGKQRLDAFLESQG